MTDQPTPPNPFPPAEAIEAALVANSEPVMGPRHWSAYQRHHMESAILAALPLMGIAELLREAADEMQGTDNALAFHDVGDGDSKYPALLRAMADRIEGKTT